VRGREGSNPAGPSLAGVVPTLHGRERLGTVDIDLNIMEEAYSLPEYSGKDPADRIVVATARVPQCPVITADPRILEYAHVKTVW
jgi:PIN domain nuclease of toxin-antitoxin system